MDTTLEIRDLEKERNMNEVSSWVTTNASLEKTHRECLGQPQGEADSEVASQGRSRIGWISKRCVRLDEEDQ
jgi:hypothetical protein